IRDRNVTGVQTCALPILYVMVEPTSSPVSVYVLPVAPGILPPSLYHWPATDANSSSLKVASVALSVDPACSLSPSLMVISGFEPSSTASGATTATGSEYEYSCTIPELRLYAAIVRYRNQ